MYQKATAKKCRDREMRMWIFLFQLPDVKILERNRIFSVRSKQKGMFQESGQKSTN